MKALITDMGSMPSLLPKEYLMQSIIDIFNNGLPQGLYTKVSNLDDVFRLDRGRVITITGVPNYGKSEFVDFLTTTYNKLYGMKTLYFSPENQPLSYHMAKLVSKYTNKRLKDSDLTEAQNVASYVCDNFFFFNYQKISRLSQILDLGATMVSDKGVSILVLDAFNKIETERPNEQTETEFVSKIMDALCNFAIKYNVMVILVAHPRKMTYDHTVEAYSCPNAYDINGSANFYNKSDFVFTVHRDFKEEETIIRCDKVKFNNYGKMGECRLKYDINSGNYYNASRRDKRYFYEDDEELTYTPIEFTIPTAVVNDPLNVEVSLYKGVSDNIGTTVNLKDFLFTDQYKDIAEAIRSGKTIEERHEIKNRYRTALPCATVSGRFTERKRDKVAEYSGLIAIDIDYKDNVEVMANVPNILKQMDFIIYAGKSISGDGYFAICRIDEPKRLKEHYLALEKDFKEYGITIDKACKDTTRLRFASYNPDPYYNPNALTYYKVVEEPRKEDRRVSTTMRPQDIQFHTTSTDSCKKVEDGIKYLRDNGLTLPDDYASWFKAGMSLCSEFGEAGRQYFHSISSLSPKYDRYECDNQYDKIVESYGSGNDIGLGTLMYMFKEAKRV